MSQKKHIVIYSHGFGVRKDGRGLLSDVAGSLENVESVLFDYDEVDEEKKEITARKFSEQAKLLKKNIDDARAKNPDAVIDLICHSQGCIIAALVNLKEIRKTIFIATPFEKGSKKMIEVLESRSGTEINKNGVSKLFRQDGSTTIILPEYWIERDGTDPMEFYEKLEKNTELIIINAKQDELLGEGDFSNLNNSEIININGGHNFEGDSRVKLIEIIASRLA